MNDTDISKVYLLSVPLENDYKNTLYFNNRTEQEAYFSSKIVKYFDDFTYQRKDNLIRIPFCYDDLYQCNYVMYQNKKYSNKWFYAFITEMKYISDKVTEVHIETDVMQTWAFDYDIKASFVEREHVSDDRFGKHTVAENLDTGEYVVNHTKIIPVNSTYRYIVGVTRDYVDKSQVGGLIYNGIYSGVKYYAFETYTEVNKFITNYDNGNGTDDEGGYGEDVVCMFIAPSWILGGTDENKAIPGSNVATEKYIKVKTDESVDTYKPRNNRLLCYPFRYMVLDNNAGGEALFHYELFDDPDISEIEFTAIGSITPGCSLYLYPTWYGNGLNYGLPLAKLPICNWTSDTYTNWLTQNSMNMNIQIAQGGLSIAGGILGALTGGITGVGGISSGASGVISGASQIANTLAQKHQASFSPMQSKGCLNSGDVIYSAGFANPSLMEMSVRKEYAKIIDGYFDMYGYQINTVKVPNKCHRNIWWYTKTIDINIDGSIPANDMQKIKDCYNRGITFWRGSKVEYIGDYTADNSINITGGAITDLEEVV